MTPGPLARDALEALFAAALEPVAGEAAVRRCACRGPGGVIRIAGEPLPAEASITLLAAGKAAVPMARAFVELAGDQVDSGRVYTKTGHGGGVPRLEVRESAHPVPDARSEAAGRDALALAGCAPPGGVGVVLLSGGASSILACPATGLTLADLAETTEVLLASGAAIGEVNTVRKHLSAVAGGQLARGFGGAPIHLLAISDVPGDDLAVIGSGPCSPDPTTFAEALGILTDRGIERRVPGVVRERLAAGARGAHAETPKPGDPSLARVRAQVVGGNRDALEAAAAAAKGQGLRAEIDPEPLAGEAKEAAPALLRRARAAADGKPLLWIAGGETTVTFEEAGRGGRNQEFALAAAIATAGAPDVSLLAAGTDGTDGPTDAAGAFVDGGSVARGRAQGILAEDALARHDSYTFWGSEGGLFRTGPTGTNVMDVVFVSLS